MKKKKMIIIFAVFAVIAVAVIFLSTSVSNWSNKSFEATVQEIVTQPNGKIRLIVERTTEIYGKPLNSLSISKDTSLIDENGNELSIEDFLPGVTVEVRVKDAFTEEAIFYYPTVYEIKIIQ